MRLICADALLEAISNYDVKTKSYYAITDIITNAPTVQMESLTARITELEQKLAHKTYHCQANLDELKRTIRMLHDKEQEFKKLESKKFAKFDNEECWIYQGDGYDNLESLACPVVINPNVLINLINSPTVQREGWVSAELIKPPKDKDSLILTMYGLAFVGRERYGTLGEPQQDKYAYRCSSSGRFVEKISHWHPLPIASKLNEVK